MSGIWGNNRRGASATKGRRRQSAPCEGCGSAVSFFDRPRRVRCRACWHSWWDARDAIIAERLQVAYPDGEPRREQYPTYGAYVLDAMAHRSSTNHYLNNSRSIPDDEILARLSQISAVA